MAAGWVAGADPRFAPAASAEIAVDLLEARGLDGLDLPMWRFVRGRIRAAVPPGLSALSSSSIPGTRAAVCSA
jgi:hypothetical protein